MPWFEDHLAAVGRAIDSRVEAASDAVRYRTRRPREGLGDKVRRARDRAAETIEDRLVRPAREVNPQVRRRILLGALSVPVLILAGVGIRSLLGPPVVERATPTEVARLQASLEKAGTSPIAGPPDHFSQFVPPPGSSTLPPAPAPAARPVGQR